MPRLFRFALAVVLYAAVTAPAHGQSTMVAEAAPATSRPAPAPLSVQQIFEQSAPAVVLIAQYDANDKMTSLGSGFAVSPNGVIVTNNHVITPDPGAVRIAVKVPNGRVLRTCVLSTRTLAATSPFYRSTRPGSLGSRSGTQ